LRTAPVFLVLLAGVAPLFARDEPRRPSPPVAQDARAPQQIAGMTLEMKGGRIVVGQVMPGSGAAAAGILSGDVLLEVNGFPLIDLNPISPEAALRLFEAGGTGGIRLVFGRGAGTIGVTLPMRPPEQPSGTLPSPEPPRVGALAPGFTSTAFGGDEVRLDALRGKPVLLDFWASWCPPCREQTITLRRLAEHYKDRLAIVGVSLDEDKREFEAFIYNHHLPGLQIFDGGPQGPIARLYAVPSAGIPYSVLIDRDGRIVALGTSLQEKEEAIARLAIKGDGGARRRGAQP